MNTDAKRARNAIQSIGHACDECVWHSYEAEPKSFDGGSAYTLVRVLCAAHGLGTKPRASACTDFVLASPMVIELENPE